MKIKSLILCTLFALSSTRTLRSEPLSFAAAMAFMALKVKAGFAICTATKTACAITIGCATGGGIVVGIGIKTLWNRMYQQLPEMDKDKINAAEIRILKAKLHASDQEKSAFFKKLEGIEKELKDSKAFEIYLHKICSNFLVAYQQYGTHADVPAYVKELYKQMSSLHDLVEPLKSEKAHA